MYKLEQITDDIYVQARPFNLFGFNIGVRMAIIRLNQGLLIYSPVKMNPQLVEEIRQLGEVKWILAPNAYHHLFAGHCQQAFPEAALYLAPGLEKKRSDLIPKAILLDQQDFPWSQELESAAIKGMPKFNEYVLFDKRSNTLICCDLIFNLHNPQGLMTRLYHLFMCPANRPAVSRVFRAMIKDKAAFTNSLKPALNFPTEKIIMAHGLIINEKGQTILKELWLD